MTRWPFPHVADLFYSNAWQNKEKESEWESDFPVQRQSERMWHVVVEITSQNMKKWTPEREMADSTRDANLLPLVVDVPFVRRTQATRIINFLVTFAISRR